MNAIDSPASNFIRDLIIADKASGKNDGRVRVRSDRRSGFRFQSQHVAQAERRERG